MTNSISSFLEELAAGTKSVKELKVLESADGSDINLRMVLFKGVQTGPTVYVGGGIHGDEVNGIEVVRRFLKLIDARKLKGNLIAVPIQNIMAYLVRSRFMPVVGVGRIPDLHTAFPGKPDGNPAEIVAHTLLERVMAHVDFVVEFHSATTGTTNAVYIFTPPAKFGETSRRAEEIAEAFGPKFIFSGVYEKHEGMLQNVVASRGIPAIGVELGEGGRIEEELVEQGIEGMMNILRHLKMIEGAPERLGKQIRIGKIVYVRSSCGGILHAKAKVGDQVHKNDTLAVVSDPFDDREEEIRAPVDGYITKMWRLATVITGDLISVIGTP